LQVVYQDQALGLGHAVLCAKDLVGDEAFAVLFPDDFLLCDRPCLKQMVEAWRFVGGNMVATVDVGRDAISAYGCLNVKTQSGRLLLADGVVEKPDASQAPSTHAVVGRYILQSSVIQELARTRPGAGNEIQLTDAIAEDSKASKLFGLEFEGRRFDCGQPAGFAEATMTMAGLAHLQLSAAA